MKKTLRNKRLVRLCALMFVASFHEDKSNSRFTKCKKILTKFGKLTKFFIANNSACFYLGENVVCIAKK